MAQKYQLTYFNGKGRGERARLLFAAAGKKYEDRRIEFKDWPEEKKNAPQGSLPYLKIDGKITASQSMAISRYLAREFSLYGKNSTEKLYIDEIVDTALELFTKGVEVAFASDETKKKEMMTTYRGETAPKLLGFLEKAVTARGKDGFAVGSGLSLADIEIYVAIEIPKLEEELSKYPKLKANRAKVEANKNIAAWLKIRPETAF